MSNREATIYIPTRGRVGKQVTWSNLSKHWRARTILVSTPAEAIQLRALGYNAMSCPAEGIGPTRQWILDQHDTDLLGEVIVMMDDDLGFGRRREDDPGKFLPAVGEDTNPMMEKLVGMTDFAPFGGMSNRSGANFETAPYRLNIRIHDLLLFDVPITRHEGIRIDRVQFMEDFDTSLQFLTKGYPTLALNSYCKGDAGSNADGGCSLYRTDAGQAAAAYAMAKLWPFVKITERPGWKGGTGTRVDVRIAWSKAYASGIEGRDLLGIPQHPKISWEDGSLRNFE